MNWTWVGPAFTGLGMIANAIWMAVNMQMRHDLEKQISELKGWMAHEYVTAEICRVRMDKE